MKSQSILFFALLLIITLSFTRCSNGAGDQKDFRMPTADSILANYNSTHEEWDRTTKEEGKIKITAADDLITIDLEQDSSLEIFSYFLQTENSKGHHLSVPEGRAEVLYMDRILLVNYLDQRRTLLFKIGTDKNPAYMEGMKNVQEIVGFGLGMRAVSRAYKLQDGPLCTCIHEGNTQWSCQNTTGDLNCGRTNNAGRCRITCSGQSSACCDARM